jgi:CheY-like chemotaxis protein
MMSGGRIHVVDDSTATRKVWADALEVQGYQVQTAADGWQVWDLVRQNPTAYDLVLSDVTMPGLDGLELLTKIRVDAPWLQVILMTGRPDPAIPVRAQRLGAVAVLPKPWGLEELYQALRRALLERRRSTG